MCNSTFIQVGQAGQGRAGQAYSLCLTSCLNISSPWLVLVLPHLVLVCTAPGSDLRTNHLVTSCMYSVLSLALHVHKLLNVDTLYPFFSSSFSWIQLILTIFSRRILVVYLWPPLLPDPFMSVS